MNTTLSTQQPAQRPSALRTMAGRLNVEADSLLSTLKATVCKGCTDPEVMAFSIVANEYNLNPFIKHIYAFPAKGGGIVPVVSVDGWITMTNNHPQMDGIEFEDEHDEKGNLIAIACTIYRKDRSRPIRAKEYLDECKRPTDPWKMPHRMLRHKALIQTSRIAFGFSGITDDDEADDIARNGGMREATGHVVESTPTKVITGAGTDPAPAKAPRGTKAPPAAATQPETAPEPAAPTATKVPPRPDMVTAIRTAYRAAGLKTLPDAEERARKAGYLAEGMGFSGLKDEEMAVIVANLDTIYVAFPEETPTEGEQSA